MNVHLLEADANRYQALAFRREDEWDQLLDAFEGQSVGASWRFFAVEFLREKRADSRLLPGNFPSLGGIIPVFSQRAVEALSDLLRPNGEILPLTCTEGEYYAFNITRVVDALDEEHSEFVRFDSGGILDMMRHEFHSDRIQGLSIFKIPQMLRSRGYVTDDFVQRVQEAGLQGFGFQKVWSGPDS